MKKISIKFSIKNIFRIIYSILFILNIVSLFMLYNFFNDYIYNTIAFDENNAIYLSTKKDDINLNKFNDVIEKIENKTKL